MATIYAILIASTIYGQTDVRILIYFPVYVAALLFGRKIDLFSLEAWSGKGMLLSVVIWATAIVACVKSSSPIYLQLIVSALAIVPLYYLGTFLNQWKCLKKLLTNLGYASMCAYLFHRQFYGVAKAIIGDFKFTTAYLLVLPLLLVCSYAIQKIYDVVSKNIVKGSDTYEIGNSIDKRT